MNIKLQEEGVLVRKAFMTEVDLKGRTGLEKMKRTGILYQGKEELEPGGREDRNTFRLQSTFIK